MTKRARSIIPVTVPQPPSSLQEAGTRVWVGIQSEFAIADAPGLALLEAACHAIDQARDCQEQMKRDAGPGAEWHDAGSSAVASYGGLPGAGRSLCCNGWV